MMERKKKMQTGISMQVLDEELDDSNVTRAAGKVQRHTARCKGAWGRLDRGVHVEVLVCCSQFPQPVDVATVCQHQRLHCHIVLAHSCNTVTC